MDRLREMEMFVRVIEAGSFSAAARDLDMGQPAVSKTIASLEDRLGVRLLTRSTRKLSPTEAGHRESLLPGAKRRSAHAGGFTRTRRRYLWPELGRTGMALSAWHFGDIGVP